MDPVIGLSFCLGQNARGRAGDQLVVFPQEVWWRDRAYIRGNDGPSRVCDNLPNVLGFDRFRSLHIARVGVGGYGFVHGNLQRPQHIPLDVRFVSPWPVFRHVGSDQRKRPNALFAGFVTFSERFSNCARTYETDIFWTIDSMSLPTARQSASSAR